MKNRDSKATSDVPLPHASHCRRLYQLNTSKEKIKYLSEEPKILPCFCGEQRSSKMRPSSTGESNFEMTATAPARQNPSFFRVLIEEFQSKLGIPPVFVKYIFKGKVPTVFTLNSSDSKSSWRVRVQAEQRDCFFIGDGWSKFVEDHRLEIGDFLVFSLVGSSTFDVVTYNRSTCSKNIIQAAKKRDASQLISDVRPTEEIPTERCSSVPNREKAKGIPSTSNVRREGEFVSEETAARASFEMVLKEHQKYQIVLPRKFARETGLEMESKTKIKDPRGDIWSINITLCANQVRLGSQWTQLLCENGIAVGDTLRFEHIESQGNLLQIHVVHKQANAREQNTTPVAGKRGSGQPRRQVEEPSSKKCAPRTFMQTEDLIARKTSFDIVLKAHQRYHAVVPMGFSNEMGLAEEPITVIKGSDGRKWRMNILVDGRSFVRFGAGWSKFLEDNGLKVGDTISFWHIPNTGNVINFKITSKAGDGTRGKRSM